jgi:hypothetical protein
MLQIMFGQHFEPLPQDLIENLKLDRSNNLNLPTCVTWTCFLAPALKSSDQFPK